MTDDAATRKLRRQIERPERCEFWGQKYTITPRLIAKVFGDGKHLLCVTPLATRPNYLVVRVDSSITDPVDEFPKCSHGTDWRACRCQSLIDAIADAAEEEYGYFGDEDERDASGDERRPFPVVDWGIGCLWGDPFPIAQWLTSPKAGRRRL